MQAYTNTDQHIHFLAQVVAKINRTFVPKKDDDSHTNVGFDSIQRRIYGRWVTSKHSRMVFSLDLKNLSYEWSDEAGKSVQIFPIEGHTITEMEIMIAENLHRLGLSDEDCFKDDLHFDIPNYSFANDLVEAIGPEALNEWVHYRTLANHTCTDALNFLQAEGETRIWPHHFDTGFYVAANSQIGIGFGMAMEDAMVGAPYFYVSGYALANNAIDYTQKPNLSNGDWKIGEHWKGAVLSLNNLGSDANATLATFIAEATTWLRQQ